MLNLIRSHQPISRADLARHSGLQRSTVSDDCRTTDQGELDHRRSERPRAEGTQDHGFLHLNQERVGIIGINIRPAATKIVLADLEAHFTAQESMPTSHDPEQFIGELTSRLTNLIKAHPGTYYEGIGVSLPGRVDLASHRLVFAPNSGGRTWI
jgi:hypothetical protein